MWKNEIVEVVFVEQLVLDELVGFFQYLGHVGDVPVADVGTEDRFEASAERVEAAIEADRDERIVCLAAEVEPRLEELAQVLRALDAERVELVRDQRVVVLVPPAGPAEHVGIVRSGRPSTMPRPYSANRSASCSKSVFLGS